MSRLQKVGNFKRRSLPYQKFFDLVPFPLVILKPDSPKFTIINANAKYLEATRTKKEKIIGRSLFDLYRNNPSEPPGCKPEEIVEHFDELLATKAPELKRTFRWDIPIPGTGQKDIRYWDMAITPVFNGNGEIIQILSAPTDVTASVLLKKSERMAKKEAEFQKNYLHDIFLQAPIGIGVYSGPDFVAELVNPSLAEFLDRDYKSLLGKPFFEVVDEAADMGWEKILHQVLYTGQPFVGLEHPVNLFRKGKLEKLYLNFIVYPFREFDERVSGVIKIAVDVTEQVLLKQALQENEERLNIAVDSANLSVWELNLQTNIVLTKKGIDLPGFPKSGEKWTVEEYLQLLLPEDRQLGIDAITEAQHTGKFDVQLRVQLEDGAIHWVRGTGKVYNDDNGKPKHIIGTTQDITASVELDQRKNDLITTISHELKTPVTALKATTQVLERKFAPSNDTSTHGMLKKMNKQLTRLTTLIHDLLDVSRIEGGKIQLGKTDFLFYDLIEDIVSDIQRITPSHEIIIENEKLIHCHSDRERLGQVLTNLLTNAIKYSPGKSKVIISATSNTKEVVCSVRDFGIGIPKEKQPYIFDRFFRVIGEQNYAFQGIGLGLFISAEIIKRLDGRIWVTSKPNEGSTFYFSVPVING